MDSTTAALLESWDRQDDIVNRLAAIIDEDLLPAKPSEDGWTIGYHLCHMHEVRYGWLNEVSRSHAETLGDLISSDGKPSIELADIRRELANSGRAIASAMRDLLESGVGRIGPYTHPVHFLEHMIWHDGWHYGLIMLAMRLAGRSPSEEWEELNAWGIWRDPEI